MFGRLKKTGLILCLLLAPAMLWAYDYKGEIREPQAITANIWMIADSDGMGNSLVVAGDDGLVLVDSKLRHLEAPFVAALDKLGALPVKYLINTHCHADHVDGNRIFAAHSTIIANDRSAAYMAKPQELALMGEDAYPPLTKATGFPDLIFTGRMTLNVNDTVMELVHVGPGHTGGDIIVYLPRENIVHVADIYFTESFPYVGIYQGGSLNYMIETARKVAAMIDDMTVVVPGHGRLSNKSEFVAYYQMLETVRDRIAGMIARGMTKEEVIAAQPLADFPYYTRGEILAFNADQFTELYYMDLVRFKK